MLWRVHSIHHTDTAVDISTGFRHHPLELLFVAAGHAAVAVALGLSAPGLMAYAAVAVGLTIWTHANLRVPPRLEQWLRLLFVTPAMHHAHHSASQPVITPAMHHAHHSASQPVTDSNYGELFSIWDRCFGTYTSLSEEALRATRFGLGESHDPNAGCILEQLRLPFASGPGQSRDATAGR
jgi:sterol desaturase/sphingolipid hydroxylase (fatty acid hydroxylase superfamily)